MLLGFGLWVRSVPPAAPKIQKLEVPPNGNANSNIGVSVEEDGSTPRVSVEEDEGETMEL